MIQLAQSKILLGLFLALPVTILLWSPVEFGKDAGLATGVTLLLCLFFTGLVWLLAKIGSKIKPTQTVGEKPCPYCFEQIKVAAKVCRFCRSPLTVGTAPLLAACIILSLYLVYAHASKSADDTFTSIDSSINETDGKISSLEAEVEDLRSDVSNLELQ